MSDERNGQNGHSNGHSNGHNGHSNGHSNGHGAHHATWAGAAHPLLPRTVIDGMETAHVAGDRTGFTFIDNDGNEHTLGWRTLVDEARRRGRQLRARGLAKGDRVALIIPEADQFVPSAAPEGKVYDAMPVSLSVPLPVTSKEPPPAASGLK